MGKGSQLKDGDGVVTHEDLREEVRRALREELRRGATEEVVADTVLKAAAVAGMGEHVAVMVDAGPTAAPDHAGGDIDINHGMHLVDRGE